MARKADDTVIVRPPRKSRSWISAALAVVVAVAAMGFGTVWLERPLAPVPPPGLAMASEADIQAESPATLNVLRFNYNPAILVLDFPTLAEQGRMLNRIAAWVEKAGVPHDRLLTDTELTAAILASGATPDTYYYGHDYRAADVLKFFTLADRDHITLNPDEQELGHIVARAKGEPFGFGALISLPRADDANGVDASARIAILHHELSHGEYFTNASYARFVHTVWDTVLTGTERVAFRSYLAADGYDPALEDLMINEMQAYLMHTPDPRFFDVSKLGIPAARLRQIRESFVAGMPSCWLRDVTTATPVAASVRAPRRRPASTRGGRPRQGRVSSTTAAAAKLPPRRRRASIAV